MPHSDKRECVVKLRNRYNQDEINGEQFVDEIMALFSHERDIHAQAMYDLARECGWTECSSRPPVCFIKDKFAVPSVTLQGPSSFHTPGDPIGTAINEKQRQLNAASSAEGEKS